MERRRRHGASDLDLVLSCDGRRLRRSREDTESLRLRRAAGTVLAEADVTAVLLMVIRAAAAAVVPVAGVTVAPAVVVSLARSLVSVGALAAGPVAEPDVTDREEEGAGVRAAEEPVALIGAVACSFTCC